jgi:hypothetical protein
LVKRVPNAVLGKKVAADSRVNPANVPSAVADAIGINY